MKTICIFSPCRYTRNVIHSLCHDYANNGSLNGNKVRALSFSDVSVFEFLINSERWENIDKVIVINSGNLSPVTEILKKILLTGRKDTCLIAGENYRNFADSYLWSRAPEYIDIDSSMPQFRRSLKEFVQRTGCREELKDKKQLHLLNHMEISVLNYFLAGLDSGQIQTEMSISDKAVSYYKRRILQKSGAKSLLQFAWLFGTSAPVWMQQNYFDNKGELA